MSHIPVAILLIASCSAAHTMHSEKLLPCLINLINGNAPKFANQINLFGANLSTYRDLDLREALLLGKNPWVTVNLVPYGQLQNFNHRQLVIWMVNTMDEFERQFKDVSQMNVEFRGHFVVVLKGEFIWKAVLGHFWNIGVTNVILMVEEEDEESIFVVGYQPFQEDCCRCVAPKVVDRCFKGKFEEGKFEFLFDNFVRRMYGCPLRIATFTRLPFIEVVDSREGRMVLQGAEGDMLETISRRMNFTIDVTVPKGDHVWGQVYPNGSGVGAIGLVVMGEVDCTIGGFVPYALLVKFTSSSIGYYMTDFVFVVPEELAEISSLRQLSKPLGKWIWIGIAAVLCTAYIVVKAFNYPEVGQFSEFPTLTLFRVTLGDSLPSLPRGNFFRFLMFMLLYHYLIIRESYKCSMISHLTEKKHLNDISTFETMISEGYSFAITFPLYDLLFKETLQLDGSVILLSEEEYSRGLVQIISERRRIAMISIPEEIVDFNHRHPNWLNFRVCEENLMRFHFSVYFRRSSPMVREFDRLVQRMLAGGLMAKWHATLMNRRYQATTLNDEPATVLTNGHLFSGYIFLAVGLGVAGLAFLLEVASVRSGKIRFVLNRL
ncbi:uncharacterized protein LOC134207393 [Armigeres subalbatus]|uniref:uncharacterized protein LOC134207393 n=1 Tax=Armigeres subalbatus TaxID=124917 RepID=UPI002ED4085D